MVEHCPKILASEGEAGPTVELVYNNGSGDRVKFRPSLLFIEII